MLDDSRWGDDARDRDDDDWRDRGDRDGLTSGRDPGSYSPRDDQLDRDPRDRDDDRRGLDRDRDGGIATTGRIRVMPFTRDLNLPRGPRARDRATTAIVSTRLRGSETRTLSTVGAFRVVSGARSPRPRRAARRPAVRRPPTPARAGARRDRAAHRSPRPVVVLTERGRGLLEPTPGGPPPRPAPGVLRRPCQTHRELEHDAQVYRAYLREARKLGDRGARIERVVLDYELKRDYQQWLHERDRDRDDYDGHPDRDGA